MDIVQITDRILVSIGIGMSAAFHLFRFSIMTLMPAIEDIKTDVLFGRIVVRKSIDHNGQCFGQYITDFFSDKEQGTESEPLPFTDIFTGIYIVYLFL